MLMFAKKSPPGKVPSPGEITVWMFLTATFFVLVLIEAALRSKGWFLFDGAMFVFCLDHFYTRCRKRDDALNNDGE